MDLPVIKPKTTILGIGGSGIKIINALKSLKGSEWLNLGVADTDITSLNNIDIPNKFPVGIEWTKGIGCGGDPKIGAKAFAHKQKQDIDDFITASSLLIITGGLGGGSATGGANSIGRMAKRKNIPVIFVATLPFAFEGSVKRDIAENGIKDVSPNIDIMLPIPNDILFTSLAPETPAMKAFEKADESIATAILGISEILRCNNLISTGLADMKEIMGGRKAVCHIGLGESNSSDESKDRIANTIQNLLESPLLGGVEALKKADALIVSAIGGDDFSISEMQQSLNLIKDLSKEDARVLTGVNTDPIYNGKIFITAITIMYDKSESSTSSEDKDRFFQRGTPIIQKANRHQTGTNNNKREGMEQPLLSLFEGTRGYFAKTKINNYEGVDLDVPTVQREGIILDAGK